MTLHANATSVLSTLRRETREHHDRLEAGLDLLGPSLTPERYRWLLERFWGFCAPTERVVERSGVWEALGLDGGERDRRGRLERDLLALGHTPGSVALLPLHPVPPSLGEAPEAAGYLYVMEGATLGGSVISRHLARTLGITSGAGGAFFGSYGAELGPMWKRFTHALGAYAARSGVEPRIVRGACDTFSSLEQWLLHPPA